MAQAHGPFFRQPPGFMLAGDSVTHTPTAHTGSVVAHPIEDWDNTPGSDRAFVDFGVNGKIWVRASDLTVN